jgi:hypothetical protein
MTKATVDAGICGFSIAITVNSLDSQHATARIETACPNLKPLETLALEMDAYAECFSKIGESSAFEFLRGYCRHPGCPVASGIIKALEVECGLALPKDAGIHIENNNA